MASSTAPISTSPFSAVCVRVALISWIEAEVWSTLAARASALRARCCIWEAISTIVDEVSSVELDCISAPFRHLGGGGGDLFGRHRHRTGRHRDLGGDLAQALHHLPHRVLQPPDLVARLAADVGRQIALGDLLRQDAETGERVGDEPGQTEGQENAGTDREDHQDEDRGPGVLEDLRGRGRVVAGGVEPLQRAQSLPPSRLVSASTPAKPVRIFRRIVQSLIVCCQALPIVLILGRSAVIRSAATPCRDPAA